MRNLFEKETSDTILERIGALQANADAAWGKMNPAQMLAHCSVPLEIALGQRPAKRSLIGRWFGSLAKKKLLNEKPFDKHLPTDKTFITHGLDHEFDKEKQRLTALIKEFHIKGEAGFTNKLHPFFGEMSAQEWSLLQAKH